jgi:hypothetical protein
MSSAPIWRRCDKTLMTPTFEVQKVAMPRTRQFFPADRRIEDFPDTAEESMGSSEIAVGIKGMRTSTLEQFKRHLRPGSVYRRENLLSWSRSVDRHLKELTVDGTLQKLRTGLYYCPRKFEFGQAPADEHELVKAFLRTDHFVITSPNLYNQLGLGTTQLYNKRVVYNQKRHGTFSLGNRMVIFQRRLNVPKQLSPEFLLVDLVNELSALAEDQDAVLSRVRERAKKMDPRKLSRAVSLYGKHSTQKKFGEMLHNAG